MSFRVLGTNHTSFTVSNLDRTVGFFRDCLGFELIKYRAPASKGAVKARPCDTGFAHVAFNVDDAVAAVAAVELYGVKPVSPPVTIDQGPNKGRRVVYVRDWDGVTLEFIEVAAR
jgi:catechol 2,3-dioxygenase-like lactoylglutathione lyase family enzyme